MTVPVTPRLSATVLLLRDKPEGFEVFMVVRHHQIDFASGAIVFPGGSLDDSDRDPRVRAVADGASGLDDETLAVRVAALRESFEECGVLYARDPATGRIIDGGRAKFLGEKYREPLETNEIGVADMAEAEGLRLALDEMTPFAHWITPDHMRKRFSTHFFVARAPDDHALLHDGSEAVDSVWIKPADALSQAEAGKLTMIFATRLNLARVGQSATVADAIAKAATDKIVTVQPTVRKSDAGRILTIPVEAGYGGPDFLGPPSALADDKMNPKRID
jgi:8-oxo-dGTP pyrophosphatase MutT (NUDIX family)